MSLLFFLYEVFKVGKINRGVRVGVVVIFVGLGVLVIETRFEVEIYRVLMMLCFLICILVKEVFCFENSLSCIFKINFFFVVMFFFNKIFFEK